MSAPRYPGQCFCGAVRFELHGAPVAMGYCHCTDCRAWAAAPVNAFTLWPPAALKPVAGAARIAQFSKTPNSVRHWCMDCGGHLYTAHPAMDLVDVYAALIPDFPFAPGVHVHYAETVLHLADGLPKLHDLPAEMGGSGQRLPD